ncbi:Homeobox-leucine zipper protein ROC8 [Rhynchospora pubera]|uniref:Homeobox-leucine zipper protein ROC8 n=1 Tax=Rhynchospora pubera TaxID=906938 RepID=A0AAV8FNU6_9POAL|nr:Homeobox-leucine zipper protein ROC8 [Rhynchospora pubera]KAJ4817657.1 Homeobox-leucine zipper protein ROC8 [Rhynchospora pubera]
MDFGEEPDGGSDRQKRKTRYHRHTPRQIQQLESMFKECPHPDEKQRMQLSREVGLDPRQIKFWFQNRRTQMKAQHERADNCFLRAENDKIRCENIAMREALKNVMCPNCGAPPISEDSYFDEQKLRMENARLKEELDRVSGLTSKYLGRPITQLPSIQPLSISSLDLSVGGLGSPSVGPSLDLDLLTGGSSNMPFSFPTAISDMEKPIMAEMATVAMDELVRLAQSEEPLWVKQSDGREVLSLDAYDSLFPKPGNQFRAPDIRVEATKDSALVFMNAVSLVDMFLDSSKWIEFFPSIISKTRTIDILANGMAGRSGSLLLMYEELHVLSPVVPTREFCFLRYCRQIEQGLWAIADVSVDLSREIQFSTPPSTRRLPSGCLIQEIPNGYSKITWVEHMEIEDKALVHLLYRELVISGAAFGAQRWLATLQRTCERFACLMTVANSPRDIGGVTPEGKRSMMKLSQKMVNNFCASLSASQMHRWTALSGASDEGVRVTVHRSSEPGQPSGVVLSAATSIWLPVSCERVFNFLKDERSQWDVLSSGNSVQEVTSIATGSHPGNCISLLRGLNASQNSMLILQESCADASGSLVIYSPIEFNYIDIVMSGQDPTNIPLQPSSGFTILPDGRVGVPAGGASTSSNPMGSSYGSLLTVAFQILVSSLPSAKLNVESVSTVNNLISTTVQQIKAALNCPSG